MYLNFPNSKSAPVGRTNHTRLKKGGNLVLVDMAATLKGNNKVGHSRAENGDTKDLTVMSPKQPRQEGNLSTACFGIMCKPVHGMKSRLVEVIKHWCGTSS